MYRLTSIRLQGYRSIEDMPALELRPVNVLIGPNGAGKSNLLSFLDLMHDIADVRLQVHVGRSGGADAVLRYGARHTPLLRAELEFANETDSIRYCFTLSGAARETLVFEYESLQYARHKDGNESSDCYVFPRQGTTESALSEASGRALEAARAVSEICRQCRVYRFSDTSSQSPLRRSCYIHDNRWLQPDGGNLAAILYRLKRNATFAYDRIVGATRQVLPWFGDYAIEPLELDKNRVALDWREPDSEVLFGAHQLPDGALRAMALIALLLQPSDFLPAVLAIDEPELGLHPAALVVVAGLARAASCNSQVLLATQSSFFLDQFETEDVVVVDRRASSTEFRRLDTASLRDWLAEYSLAELWEKNVLGGGPY